MAAVLTDPPIGSTFIKPEAGQGVYWTKVSANAKVRIGHIAKEWCALSPTCIQHRGIVNTIVQLQSRLPPDKISLEIAMCERLVQSSQSADRGVRRRRRRAKKKSEDKSKWRKTSAESTSTRSRVALGVWSAWHQRTVGGFIFAGVRSVGHIGCCDSSPSQHASRHAAATGHPIIASFEPGEDWFYDYKKQRMIEGAKLLPPRSHPRNRPVPGPAGRVPANWESVLN